MYFNSSVRFAHSCLLFRKVNESRTSDENTIKMSGVFVITAAEKKAYSIAQVSAIFFQFRCYSSLHNKMTEYNNNNTVHSCSGQLWCRCSIATVVDILYKSMKFFPSVTPSSDDQEHLALSTVVSISLLLRAACRYGDWDVWLSEYQIYCRTFDQYYVEYNKWLCLMVRDNLLQSLEKVQSF